MAKLEYNIIKDEKRKFLEKEIEVIKEDKYHECEENAYFRMPV